FTVKKATATVNLNYKKKKGVLTAWFTPDLPFQFGPIGYAGLPGLILELSIRGITYYADDIQLDDEPKVIKEPTNGERMCFGQFGNAMDKRVKAVGHWND